MSCLIPTESFNLGAASFVSTDHTLAELVLTMLAAQNTLVDLTGEAIVVSNVLDVTGEPIPFLMALKGKVVWPKQSLFCWVKLEQVQEVMDVQWRFRPVFWLWRCVRPEWRAGRYQWISLQSWLPVVVCFYLVCWLIQTRQWWMSSVQTEWLQCRTGSATLEAGWTLQAGAGNTSSAWPFWCQSRCWTTFQSWEVVDPSNLKVFTADTSDWVWEHVSITEAKLVWCITYASARNTAFWTVMADGVVC